MNQMNQVQDDEIDLFEFSQTLWDGKWIISVFVAMAILLGGSFLWYKDPLYESKLIYSIDTLPPFYGGQKALTDFRRKFYSKSIFEEWKKNSGNVSLVFEDFSATEVVDGFIMSKKQDRQLALLGSDRKGSSFILVKSRQLRVLDDFFKYTQHINEVLKSEYVIRAKDELNIIETRFKDFSTANDAIISQILAVDRYIVAVENGASVLAVLRPTMPEKISPRNIRTLAMSVVIGVMFGVFFILVRNASKRREKQLAKA